MSRLVFALLLLVAAVYSRHEQYEGHQVYRIQGSSKDILYLDNKVDILSATSASTSDFDVLEAVVRLSPQEQPLWLDYFVTTGISYTKIIDNLSDVLRKEDADIAKSRLDAKLKSNLIKENESLNENATNESHSDENDNSSDESNSSGASNDSSASNENVDSNENSESNGSSASHESKSEDSNESSDSHASSASNEKEDSEESNSSSASSEHSDSSESNENSNEVNGSEEAATEEEEDDDRWSIKWNTYYNHEEINSLIDEVGAKYPNLVTIINPALTYEGRQIKYVRISTNRFEDVRKPVVVVNAGIHGRDWMTTSAALYIINQLVVDPADSELVEKVDWIIVPLSNPDGYEWTINEDRLWRKTRSLNHAASFLCPGVDASRNFDHYWGTDPNVSIPCSEEYEGPSVFSEPEARIIRDALLQQQSRAAMYLSLQHERANMILYPWAQSGTLPPNALSLHLNGIRMAAEIGGAYTVGNAGQVLANPTGTGIDWARALEVPLAYILELPAVDGVDVAFLAPPEVIPDVTAQTWAGIEEAARYVISLYY